MIWANIPKAFLAECRTGKIKKVSTFFTPRVKVLFLSVLAIVLRKTQSVLLSFMNF